MLLVLTYTRRCPGINVGCEVTMAECPRVHVARLRRIMVEATTPRQKFVLDWAI